MEIFLWKDGSVRRRTAGRCPIGKKWKDVHQGSAPPLPDGINGDILNFDDLAALLQGCGETLRRS